MSLDYIRFNEFIYICWIHKKSFIYYCSICGKLFCSECKNLNNHEFTRLNQEKKRIYKSISKNIQIKLEKLIKAMEKEKEKKNLFKIKINFEEISSLIRDDLSSMIYLYIIQILH